MALTGTDRGTGTNNTSATTFTLSPTSNFTGGIAVIAISSDNSHTGGTAFTTYTVTDTLGNTWVRRASPLVDPGAANAGQEGAFFDTIQNGGLLQTGTVITVTVDTASTAQTWTLMQVSGSVGTPVFVTSAIGTSGTGTTSPTITTGSIRNGDMVIAGLFLEAGTTEVVTADADTTNGSWSTQQTASIGTTTSGSVVATQRKIVTATATQTYNPTLSILGDLALGWVEYREMPNKPAQAQAQIKKINNNVSSQAQTKIKVIGIEGFSQANADIKQTYPLVRTYRDVTLSKSPAAYWRLGDSSGPTITATVGNNQTAANSPTFGTTGLLTGDTDTAMTFVAASSQASNGSDSGLPTGNNPWSVEAWVKFTSVAEMVFVYWGTSGTNGDVAIGLFQGKITFDSAGLFNQFGTTLNDGVRHHVVVTWNGTTMLAYIDGSQTGSGYTPGAFNLILNGATGAAIGARGGTFRFYDGVLDEVAIYPTCLTPTQITEQHDIGTAPIVDSPTFAQAQASIKLTQGYAQAQGFVKKSAGYALAAAVISGIATLPFLDTFTRSASNGLGTSDNGDVWVQTLGQVADSSVNGSQAVTVISSSSTTINVYELQKTLIKRSSAGHGLEFSGVYTSDKVPTGNSQGLYGAMADKSSSTGNTIGFIINIQTNGTIALSSSYNLSVVTSTQTAYTPGDSYNFKVQMFPLSQETNLQFRIKLWKVGNTEPAFGAFVTQTTNEKFPVGFVRIELENVNVVGNPPITKTYDDLQIIEVWRTQQAQAQVYILRSHTHAQAAAYFAGTYNHVIDNFNRSATDSWGTSSDGQIWVVASGSTASVFDIDGSKATITTPGAAAQSMGASNVTMAFNDDFPGFAVRYIYTSHSTSFTVSTWVGATSPGAGDGTGISVIGNGTYVTYRIFDATTSVLGPDIGAGIPAIDEAWYAVLHKYRTSNNKYRVRFKTWKVGTTEPGWQADVSTETYSTNIHTLNRPYVAVTPGSGSNASLDDFELIYAGMTVPAQAQVYIAPTSNVVRDDFNRTVGSGTNWGTSSGGDTWNIMAGDNGGGTYSVDGSQGVLTQTSGFVTGYQQLPHTGLGFNNTTPGISGRYIFSFDDATFTKTLSVVNSDFSGATSLINLGHNIRISTSFGSSGNSTGSTLKINGVTLVTLPVVTIGVGEQWQLIYQVFRTSNDSILGRVKFYKVGSTEPAWTTGTLSGYSTNTQLAGNTFVTISTLSGTATIDDLEIIYASVTYPAQAQASIVVASATSQFAQAQSDIKVTTSVFAQGQAWIKATSSAFAQAQSDIKATSNAFAQAQADIKQIGQGFGQAQADIKQTSFAFGQAQADIKQTSRGFAQAQSDIKATSFGLAQAQSDIKAIGRGFAQAQADIKVVSWVFAQSQADIKVTTSVFAQSQADIKSTTSVFAQAQADIKQTSYGFAQAQTKIATTRAYAQAQTDVKAVSWGFAQAQADVKATSFGFAQSQADIKAVSWGFVQANADIKATSFSFAQSQADIKQISWGFAQAQTKIATTRAYAQAQADIKAISWGFAQSQADIKATSFSFAQANADIKQIGYGFGQSQADIKQTYNQPAQAQADVKAIGYGFANAQADIKQISYGFGQAQATLAAVSYHPAQAQADIKVTTSVFAQAQADVKATSYGFAQAQTDVKATSNVWAQANADIKQTSYGFSQAQTKISTTRAYAQSQADIKATSWGFSQAQTDIKATSNAWAQAQADIKQKSYGFANAQADIKQTSFGFAQAQADIKATNNAFAQAQARLKAFNVQAYAQATTAIAGQSNVWAQAQAQLKAFNVQGYGQAQANVKAKSSQFAQAQADIKQTSSVFSQAQADIKQTYNGFAQAQTDIKAVTYQWAQSQVDIKAVSYGWAQAQVKINTTRAYAQAQADIKQASQGYAQAQAAIAGGSFVWAQAQADIKAKGYGFGQACADIKQKSYGFAQAQADILVTTNVWAQAQARIKQTYFGCAQAQTTIKATSYGWGQSQADIKAKSNAFAQAQTDIRVTTSVWAQAQAQISHTTFACAQAQAKIRATSYSWSQANADIKATTNQWAQAQGYVLTNQTKVAQAQAYIKLANQNAYAQGQARIKNTYFGFGQAQADIKATSTVYANAQADIKVTVNVYAQAQARIKATYSGFGQAQAAIQNGGYAHAQAQALIVLVDQNAYAQAQAFIIKPSAFAQAQALVHQPIVLDHVDISIHISITIDLTIETHVDIDNTVTETPTITLTQENGPNIELSIYQGLNIELSIRGETN